MADPKESKKTPDTLETKKGLFEKIGNCLASAGEVLKDAGIEQLAFAKDIVGLTTKIETEKAKESNLKGNEKRSGRENILSLEREKNRLQRAELLTASNKCIQNEELKKKAQEVLKSGGFDGASADSLLSLEQAERGVLSKVFAYKRGVDKDGLPVETPLDISKVAEDDEIVIDFGKNASANAKIGAADILPPSVQVVKIIDRDMNVRIGVRQIVGGRAGYYDLAGKYIPIYTGHTIRIPSAKELSRPEYKEFEKSLKVTLNTSIETDPKKLEALSLEDAKAMENFRKILGESGKEDQVSGLYNMISIEAGSGGSYKERLERMLEIARKYEKTSEGEQKELIVSLIARLTKTKEVLGDLNVDIDIDRYKAAIAKHESGGQAYFARNDDAGKKRNVRPAAWAFGKYQFTVETLAGYGEELRNPGEKEPNEERIQKFLNNPQRQEEIMDRYIKDNLQKNILPNPKIAEDMARDGTSLSYYLALTHIGGPGALSGDKLKKDWLGTSTHAYAMGVANAYERNLQSGDITSAVARIEAIPGAKVSREDIISSAEKHLGKPYKYGASGDKSIDCSQLVVESLKDNRVVNSGFDITAEGLQMISHPKSANSVERGDLVFLRKGGRITHVEIALGPVTNGYIEILDASSNAGGVTKRKQKVTSEVEVGTPYFYA